MSCPRSRSAFAFGLLLVLSSTPQLSAQDKPDEGQNKDKTLFLVARPDLGDPIFKESVVLMFPSATLASKDLVVGLIINRPASVPLSQIFPDDKALKNRSEVAYFGGPVEPMAPGVIFRSSKAAKQATLLFGDVYASFDPKFIEELMKKREKKQDLHLFVGRSQWAPEQLQFEIAAGAWDSVHAETKLIFSSSPESLWRNLMEINNPLNVAKLSETPFDLCAFLKTGAWQAAGHSAPAKFPSVKAIAF